MSGRNDDGRSKRSFGGISKTASSDDCSSGAKKTGCIESSDKGSEERRPETAQAEIGCIRRYHDGLPELRKCSRYQSIQKRQGIISVLSMVWAKIKGGIRSMINAKDVENLTKAYLHSFNTALSETRNPSLAGQAAATVLMSICSVILPREQQTASPLEALMAAVMHNAVEAKKGAEGDDPEKKDEKADEDIQKGN